MVVSVQGGVINSTMTSVDDFRSTLTGKFSDRTALLLGNRWGLVGSYGVADAMLVRQVDLEIRAPPGTVYAPLLSSRLRRDCPVGVLSCMCMSPATENPHAFPSCY